MATVRHLGLLPWCPDTSGVDYWGDPYSVGNGTPWPFGVDMEIAMKWYWRVKEWKADYSASSESGSNSSSSISVPYATNEKDLVTNFFEQTIIIGGTGYESSARLWRTPVIMTPPYNLAGVINSGLLWPQIDIQISDEDLLSYAFSNTLTLPVGAYDTYANSASIDGHFFNLYGLGFSSISVTITPNSYWPYDPNDGLGPIYNSTTGTQLRPFPSA